ncbi:MAG TPA: OmpA family protein [Puia sp.]|nr:OmpA family protein [Puia sp.]
MNKVIIGLTAFILLTTGLLQAQDIDKQVRESTWQVRDTAQSPARDTAVQVQDSARQPLDTAMQVKDSSRPAQDTSIQPKDSAKPAQDAPTPSMDNTTKPRDILQVVDSTTAKPAEKPSDPPPPAQDSVSTRPATDTIQHERAQETKRELDTRWFISPLLKFQFQDFGMLEKNRKGYLSDANTLPIQNRGNISFAASAYKNITSRISASADLGLSFGHVTNDSVLISHTSSKTFNLLNATVYYHLLNASYRLQPYISVGINDIINDASYASVPIGIGAKFNAKKIMVTGQVMYGYALSKSISNTTMYSVGVYIPIKNKKWKKQQDEDNAPYNREAKKKDSTGGKTVNNFYFNINLDSALAAKRARDKADGKDGDNINDVASGKRSDHDGAGSGDDDGVTSRQGASRRHKKGGGLKSFDLQDFNMHDFRVDTVNGRPVIKFVIYFEFNEYALTSRAFGSVDKVIAQLKNDRGNLQIDIKGYTDDVGTDEYNNFLSRKRAKTVYDYMNTRGVPAELMKAKAYGKDNPVADNKDPNQAWLNRRAEIVVREK